MRLPESTQNRFYDFLEYYRRLEYILYLFWAFFWTLNGLDKFFNGTVVQTANGPKEFGWFGVTRDQKFIDYFAKLYLPKWMALSFLYTFAVFEIMVGLMFLAILWYRKMPSVYRRLVFKMSMLIFLAFSVGDILFGDRQELWEHGTFMILTLMTYRMYIGRSQERAEVIGPKHLCALLRAANVHPVGHQSENHKRSMLPEFLPIAEQDVADRECQKDQHAHLEHKTLQRLWHFPMQQDYEEQQANQDLQNGEGVEEAQSRLFGQIKLGKVI